MSVLPIRLENLVFRAAERTVLDGLTATIDTPGITALVGPNGAGKSVSLRILDGLVEPQAGRVRFGERPAHRVRHSFVFQKPALLRGSVADNVALALLPLRLSRREAAERTLEALSRVGLERRARDPARKLSGGEQQRLALTRALVTEPELLLLDEPTSNLDPAATQAIEEIVLAAAKAGTKVILVSHNLAQVARLAADVLVLSRGRVVEQGPTRSVLADPRSPEARTYLNGELPWTSFAGAS